MRTLLAVAVAGAALIAPVAATPASADPVTSGARYVALGSSFASGPGINKVYEPGCARSTGNYAHRVASRLGLALTDATCAGATVSNVVDSNQLTVSGLHRPQIEAVTPATRLVTVTIGGNDVKYIADLYSNSCKPGDPAVPVVARPFICGKVDAAATREALAGLEKRMVGMVAAIHKRAPRARVVLVNYTTVLPASGEPCKQLPLSRAQISYSADVAAQLAGITANAARLADADLVDLAAASAGHDVCSAQPWVTGWHFAPMFFLNGGTIPYHPNAAAMTTAADLITDTLRNR